MLTWNTLRPLSKHWLATSQFLSPTWARVVGRLFEQSAPLPRSRCRRHSMWSPGPAPHGCPTLPPYLAMMSRPSGQANTRTIGQTACFNCPLREFKPGRPPRWGAPRWGRRYALFQLAGYRLAKQVSRKRDLMAPLVSPDTRCANRCIVEANETTDTATAAELHQRREGRIYYDYFRHSRTDPGRRGCSSSRSSH